MRGKQREKTRKAFDRIKMAKAKIDDNCQISGFKFVSLSLAFLALAFPLCLCASSVAGGQSAPPPHRRAVVSPWDVEAREYLGTPKSEAAVKRGLTYLASHQLADGHWS